MSAVQPSRVVPALLLLATLVLGSLGLATAASAAPTSGAAPTDGRTVSSGGRSFSASIVDGLDPSGQTVTVAGTGFDETKGIYVALCVIPPAGTTPSPCGGGQGETNAGAAWVSSNPPSYAEGQTTPYGPGGSFQLTLRIGADLGGGIDCRQLRCALATRNDHTRTSDRSQDLLLPVTFAEPAPTGTTPSPTTTAALPSTTTTTTTIPPTGFAPAATVDPDGSRVSDGTRTVRADPVLDLDPAGQDVLVEGLGFDPGRGIYVALCAVPEANGVPGPCATGSGRSAWLSNSPPDYGVDLAEPFGSGGAFTVELTMAAVIDDATDCRVVACAITTRFDDTAPADRTADLFLPVRFAESSPTPSTTVAEALDDAAAEAADDGTQDGGGSGTPMLLLAGGLLAIVGVGMLISRRRARSQEAPSSGDTPEPG